MTRAIVAALVVLAGAGCAHTKGVMPHAGAENGRSTAVHAAPGGAHPLNAQEATACTLRWSMPTTLADGRVLSTAPLDWQASYAGQSHTYRNHEFWIRNYPDTMTKYWPTVRAEAEPLPVWTGQARPGERVEWVPLAVPAYFWPHSWRIRTRQRPNGNWSLWGNPVTRADNQ